MSIPIHTIFILFYEIKNTKNPSIYICSSAIPPFINIMLPLIDFSFIVISACVNKQYLVSNILQTEILPVPLPLPTPIPLNHGHL